MKRFFLFFLAILAAIAASADKRHRLVTDINELLTPGNKFIMINSEYGQSNPYVAYVFSKYYPNQIETAGSALCPVPGIPGYPANGNNSDKKLIEFTFISGDQLSDERLRNYYSGSYLMKASNYENNSWVNYYIGTWNIGVNLQKKIESELPADPKYKLSIEPGENNSFRVYSYKDNVPYYFLVDDKNENMSLNT